MQSSLLVRVTLPLVMVFIMIGLGASLQPRDFRRVLVERKAALLGVFSQQLILPTIGLTVAWLSDIDASLRIGLVLLSACPGGVMSNLICHLARGNMALSISLTAVSSVLTLVSLPLVMMLASAVFADASDVVRVPVARALGTLVGIVMVPVMVGMMIRAKWPSHALRWNRISGRVGIALMMVLVVGICITEREILPSALVSVGPAALALNVISTLLGVTLAAMLHLSARDVVTLGVEVGVQNSALAMIIALSVMNNGTAAIPAGVYSLVMYVGATVLILVARHRIPVGA